MPAKKTMKSKSKGKGKKVLEVDSASKIPALEKILSAGKITIVLVFADWCGACTRFRKDIWNPMCNGSATHNRVAVRDDMVRNTSLANAKFNYLPSLLVVNEKGEAEAFKTPDGVTNAMPTPRSLEDMNRIVNVPVSPLSELAVANAAEEPAEMQMQTMEPMEQMSMNSMKMPANSQMPKVNKNNSKTYTPTPMTALTPEQKGGSLLNMLKDTSALPAAVLGSLSLALRGGKRGCKRSTKRTVKRSRSKRTVKRSTKSKKTRRGLMISHTPFSRKQRT